MDKKQEKMQELVEQVHELNEKSKELSETLDYIKMPVGVYLIEKEMAKEKETNLIKTLKVLIVAFSVALSLIVIAFVWYLSEYPVVTSDDRYYQEVDSQGGSSNIYDGIEVNYGKESDKE